MASNFLNFQTKLPIQLQVDFARDLSVLLKSGVSINESLELLKDQTRSSLLKKLLNEALEDVSRGSPLSATLENSSIRLRGVFISMVKAGEVSGSLTENLIFVSEWLERNMQLKKDVRSVTLYPKIVFSAAILLGAGLAIFILPRLIPVFEGMKVELPAVTRFVLNTAEFVKYNTQDIFLWALITIVFYNIISRVKPTKRILQKIYLHVPFFGSLIRAYQLALYSQLMHVLLHSGLTINQAFDIARIESTNVPYQESFNKLKEQLLKGVGLSYSLKEFPSLYPANFVSIVSVGEKTGSLEESFYNLSKYYNREIVVKTKSLPTILEPILLITIGLVVGLIALSIILPIYQLSGSLR